jgi:hypothetical protein
MEGERCGMAGQVGRVLMDGVVGLDWRWVRKAAVGKEVAGRAQGIRRKDAGWGRDDKYNTSMRAMGFAMEHSHTFDAPLAW